MDDTSHDNKDNDLKAHEPTQGASTSHDPKRADEAEHDTALEIPPVHALSTYRVGLPLALVIAFVLIGSLHYIGVIRIPFIPSPTAASYDPTQVVAIVNGESILRGPLEARYAEVRAAMTAQGGPLDAEGKTSLKNDVLTQMVNSTLITQKAKAEGMIVSDADVERSYEDLTKTFGSEQLLNDQLAAVGMTKTELLTNIRDEQLIRQYVSAHTDTSTVAVSEAEIQQFYDTHIKTQPNPAPLADVKKAIRDQLIQQKTAALLDGFVETLKKEAKIEILLN